MAMIAITTNNSIKVNAANRPWLASFRNSFMGTPDHTSLRTTCKMFPNREPQDSFLWRSGAVLIRTAAWFDPERGHSYELQTGTRHGHFQYTIADRGGTGERSGGGQEGNCRLASAVLSPPGRGRG